MIRKWIIQSLLGFFGFAAILFGAAGRLDWLWGWLWFLGLAGFLTAHPLILIPRDPELLVERSQGLRAPGVKRWDRWLVGAAGIMMIAPWIVAGLDLRLGWTKPYPVITHVVGFVVMLTGYALFLWPSPRMLFSLRVCGSRPSAVIPSP